MPTIKSLLKKYSSLPPLDLELLLSHALRQSREFLYIHPEYRLSIIQYIRWRYFFYQFRQGYSVAAITHHKEFYGIDFYVNKHTLIPRPETEMMVDEAIQEIKKTKDQEIILIDVGTGSGCIPIAIIKALEHKNIKTFAIDISHKALCVAKKNARIQNVPIKFLHGNLLEPILKSKEKGIKNNNIVITANLPYLTQDQFDSEPSIQREPHSALVADKQGLALYEELLCQIHSLLFFTPYSLLLLLEIDPSQSSAITKLINDLLPTATVEIKKDLASHDRLVIITLESF